MEEQKNILLARRYHEGEQDVYLTDRAKQYLGLHAENPFRLNVCRLVVDAVLDELEVVGFDAGEEGETKPLSEFATNAWNLNRMDALQRDVHESALRDGEAFVIVDWSEDDQRPLFVWHKRYTSTAAGATGEDAGCYMIYPADDYTQKPVAAVQRWVEPVGNTQRQRATIYYPDHFDRLLYDGGWKMIETVPWVDASGEALGIPVIHFKNASLRPEAWDAIPMQDAINKFLVDVIANADMAGFGMYKAIGFIPTSDGQQLKPDGSNAAVIAPGTIIGTTNKDAEFDKVEGSSPQPLTETLTTIIQYTAHITKTPASRFQTGAQVQSGESQKEQNKPLFSKVKARQVLFGNAWEDAIDMARKLAVLNGESLDSDAQYSTLWNQTYTLEELQAKKSLGVPLEQIWKEMGYTERAISAMKNMDEYKLKVEGQQAALESARRLQAGAQQVRR